MFAEIITIGDEILIGQIVDTNSAWMAQQLNLAGVRIKQITSVSDDRDHILKTLKDAEERADIILITGGLGPTKDDITKHTLCEYFHTKLRFNEEVYKDVERLFKGFGKEVTPVNRGQAEVPETCIPLRNEAGTAPGMWFDKGNKVFVSMPGVPFEMQFIMQKHVLPRLSEKYKLPFVVHYTVLTSGIGESDLSDKLTDWEESLAEHTIRLAYLPSPGLVKLRLSAAGDDREKLEKIIVQKIEELKKIIPEFIYGYDVYGSKEQESLEHIVGELLRAKKKKLSIAESCTGGYISHLVTRIPGSSDYYIGSVISYANEVKVHELGVSQDAIEQHGAVSQQVVEKMAEGIRKKYNTDYSIAVSGVAGPSGGTEEKPVGTVWISVATPGKIISKRYRFGDHRERNIQRSAIAALNMLRRELI